MGFAWMPARVWICFADRLSSLAGVGRGGSLVGVGQKRRGLFFCVADDGMKILTDPFVGGCGQELPVFSAQGFFLEFQKSLEGGQSEESVEMVIEGHIAPPTDGKVCGRSSLFDLVEDVTTTDGGLGSNGGFKQGGLERKDVGSHGGCAFREENHVVALVDGLGDHGDRAVCIAGAVTVYEEAACALGKKTDEGPAGYFLFGDEEPGHRRPERNDIDVAEVIGDDQTAFRGDLSADLKLHADDPRHAPSPTAGKVFLSGSRGSMGQLEKGLNHQLEDQVGSAVGKDRK